MLDLLELELQVVSNPVWVLGTELGLSEEQQVLLTAEPSFEHVLLFQTMPQVTELDLIPCVVEGDDELLILWFPRPGCSDYRQVLPHLAYK